MHEGLDVDTVKKIFLTNSFSFTSISVTFIMLLYAYYLELSNLMIAFIGGIVLLLFSPPLLNYLQKFTLARIAYLFNSFLILMTIGIVSGTESHAQFLLLTYLGLPFILFDEEPADVKVVLSSFGIIGFIYLQWHLNNYDPVFKIPDEIICDIRLINELTIFGIVLSLFYFFTSINNKYLDKLKKNKNEIEDKNKELEHFAYICSHDLSEPLRTIDGFIRIIKEESDLTNKKLNTYFSYVEAANQRMNIMIISLLEFAKLKNKNEFHIFNVYNIIGEVKIDLYQLISEKNAIIEFSNNLPNIIGLPTQVKQVFQNLIINGLKYQSPFTQPIIKISYKSTPEYWEFCVADNGIGIKVRDQKKIFQIFTRLHLKSDFQGDGIGLAFCKKIVEIHQGKIWVESIYQQGSKFYFTIKKDLALKDNHVSAEVFI
ncbi:ATP-binding protein [Flammeovirga sp. SJP92]|uniref:sensor histidine kinase n=1 Tax=Flammeovirga sp. SJP92 TaxID=1775430 RepID=UPI0007874C62|nr:ATP-binding protein [Flammeovirga sp. SJP92]KXX71343.1 hypothetical protein AVL50_06965 [Flammeovirga sp. SJP92]